MSHVDSQTKVEAQNLDDSQLKREQIRQELERRFRYCLRSGQISPLYHLMMRYKMEVQS